MSKNNRLDATQNRQKQIEAQEQIIERRRIQLEQTAKARELLDKLKSQAYQSSQGLPNDGSFLDRFKLLTGATSTNDSASSTSTIITHSVPQLNAITPSAGAEAILSSSIVELNDIPTPREINLNLIPKPSNFKLDQIRVPPVSTLTGLTIKVPSSVDQLIELVAANGDSYEDNLRTQCTRNDLNQSIRFLFDKSCVEYLEYRRAVTERRQMAGRDKYDPLNELPFDDYKNEKNSTRSTTTTSTNVSTASLEPKLFGSTQESKAKTVTIIRNDDSDSTNSDTETWKEAKERNLKNLKRKAIHSRSRKQQDVSTTDSSEDDDNDDNARFYDGRKYKMSSASSSSSVSNSKKSGEQSMAATTTTAGTPAQLDKSSESSTRPPKRKKSRWGEATPEPTTTTTVAATTTLISQQIPKTVTPATVAKPMLTTVTRSDPALLQYARQNFGTTALSEDDWKKAEEHYKINLLFQEMQRKREQLDHLAKNGKFKYEYDSDEDVNGGTWEHKLRSQEMDATLNWADALNKQCEGKHHIGDFLPPEELKKFLEKYNAQKNGTKQPDVSDYKEFKLKEDNIGYQMLQKLGWKGEGTSLGPSGSGIIEPINKAPQRENLQGLGANEVEAPNENDDEFDAYRKRMMMAYRFRPNPLNNPRRAYY